jgi:hypothetical protein
MASSQNVLLYKPGRDDTSWVDDEGQETREGCYDDEEDDDDDNEDDLSSCFPNDNGLGRHVWLSADRFGFPHRSCTV